MRPCCNMPDMKQNQKVAVGIREAAAMLSVSPRSVQNYIAAKLLTARKIGRRTVIPMRSLEEFLRIDHTSPHRHRSPKQKHTAIERWTPWLGLGIAIGKFIEVVISFFHGGSK